ncbi:hypothetical protein BDV96DRAFT_605835 [Lophiotrema nucula]|uniref:Uncharacterized protein n=1 Tax=Lophiotrema nucula TaxID=690887 RepID=A0A6A5YMD5_9PLEO|nr:hypothetical protein BDV96DRAFT_605835 [Lophiotrema nucula]
MSQNRRHCTKTSLAEPRSQATNTASTHNRPKTNTTPPAPISTSITMINPDTLKNLLDITPDCSATSTSLRRCTKRISIRSVDAFLHGLARPDLSDITAGDLWGLAQRCLCPHWKRKHQEQARTLAAEWERILGAAVQIRDDAVRAKEEELRELMEEMQEELEQELRESAAEETQEETQEVTPEGTHQTLRGEL